MSLGLARGQTDLLFCKIDWFSVEQNQRRVIEQEINGYHPDRFLNTSDDELIKYFIEKYRMEVPALNKDSITVDQKETQIDVSRGPMRFSGDPSRPFYVAGVRVEVEVPFSGDGEFFRIQPTTFSLNPPRGEVRGNSLFFHIQGTNLDATRVKQSIERTLADVETNLSNLRTSAQQFNNSIAPQIRDKIASRKRFLVTKALSPIWDSR